MQRRLPAQVARFNGDHFGDALLHGRELGAAHDGLEGDGGDHRAGEVGVVEAVVVDDALVGHQLEVLAAEGVHLAVGEVGELHAVAAAHARVHLEHAPREAVRRQPLGHGVGVQKGAVDALGRRGEHAVQGDGSGGHAWGSLVRVSRWDGAAGGGACPLGYDERRGVKSSGRQRNVANRAGLMPNRPYVLVGWT